jgi:hypothetical protein
LFFAVHLYGQENTSSKTRTQVDQDKERFENIFNMETRSLNPDEDEKHKFYLIPEKLPGWFFHPEDHVSPQRYAIGISDPGLDSSEAFRIAKLRATAMLLMSENIQLENISDYYTVIREDGAHFNKGSQFVDFTKVKTKRIYNPATFEVKKKFFTKYKEGIVLLSYKPVEKTEKDTLRVEAELMQLSREDQVLLENTVYCKFNIHSHPDSTKNTGKKILDYTYKQHGDRFAVISLSNSDTLSFPVHPYRYFSSTDTIKNDTNYINTGVGLQNGLWNAYVNLFLSNLNFYNKSLSSKVKTSYDNYSKKNQDLVRTVSMNTISFRLSGMEIKDQVLNMDIHFEEVRDEGLE